MNLCLFWGDAYEWGRPVSVFIPILVSVGWWGWNLALWKRTLRTGTCKWMMYWHCLWRHLLLLFLRGHVWPFHLLWTGGGLVWFMDPPPAIYSKPASCDGVGMRCWVLIRWCLTNCKHLGHTGWILSSGLNPACPTRWKIPAFSCGPGTLLLSLLSLSAFLWSWVKSLCCVLCLVNDLMCNWGSYWWNLISVCVLS